MSGKIHKYRGGEIEVTFDSKRCIHSAECVRRLPQVFDTARVPWVAPDSAAADLVAITVMHCPTGALHSRMSGGTDSEPIPEQNEIRVAKDGPLYLRGNLQIVDDAGAVVMQDTRMALCRCGASKNKPYCDNAHRSIKFTNICRIDSVPDQTSDEQSTSSLLQIQPSRNGPFLIDGEVTIIGSDGETSVHCMSPALCRCGGSGVKPFCDGSHNRVGFADD